MSISHDDLVNAFKTVQSLWQGVGERTEWEDVKHLSQYGTSFLRITKYLKSAIGEQVSLTEEECALEEEDDSEALQPAGLELYPRPLAVYDISHSPSYQVPVLYLTFKDFASGRRPLPDEVYQMLVPQTYKSQIETVGVMGALTLTEHPTTGVPAYFVHPCRTQEVMDSLLQGQNASPEGYFMLWCGIIGSSVGLNIPIELAQAFERAKSERNIKA